MVTRVTKAEFDKIPIILARITDSSSGSHACEQDVRPTSVGNLDGSKNQTLNLPMVDSANSEERIVNNG